MYLYSNLKPFLLNGGWYVASTQCTLVARSVHLLRSTLAIYKAYQRYPCNIGVQIGVLDAS